MIPDIVTLTVKAPNQQIEDQNIECQSSWTVKQLKGHLSNVYPSKPKTDEQKIIYSGQLLDDNIILKDVLRIYDSQMSHTMHLVCTPKRTLPEPSPPSEGPQFRIIQGPEGPQHNVPMPAGLRRRIVPGPEGLQNRNIQGPERPAEVTRPEITQNDQNHTVEIQNYFNTYVYTGRPPPDPNNPGDIYLSGPDVPVAWNNHMMMMQRAYMQYMRQYADMLQVPGAPPAPPPPETPPPAPAPAPPADDEGGARDWLDHLYAASRLAILFSLVYLYGSPARLLLVLLLAAVGYLHQIGFFRDLQVNPQEPARQPAPNANANNAANNDANVANEANAPNNAANAANNAANAANNVANAANSVANAANAASNAANAASNAANAANNAANAANNVANAANNVANAADAANNEASSVNNAANAANNVANASNNAPNEPNPANNAPNQANIPNNGVNPPTVEVNNANNGINNAQNQQSLLAVTWMIFASFFASLIPDIN